MESSNPMLSRMAKAAGLPATGATMTVAGTAWKTLVLLALVCFGAAFTWQAVAGGNTGVVMPALLVGGIGGFVLALVTVFVPRLAPFTSPVYAVLQGLLLGAVSALYDARYAGLPRTAVVLTLATAGGMYLLYATGVIRATPMFRRSSSAPRWASRWRRWWRSGRGCSARPCPSCGTARRWASASAS
jgi:uncharacterized YccA/Bax inhibitor family protein